MSVQAFTSKRIVTAKETISGAILVDRGVVQKIVAAAKIPDGIPVTDCGELAVLPGLVDSHVHVNEPGRTEWEGFDSASRAAAAGGYTTIVDMPLNCLPPTTTPEALEEKRAAAARASRVDFAFWGGVVADNQAQIEALAAAGVAGYKAFLIHPGIDGFTMVTEAELRAALPHVAKTGLPLLVHAELPGAIDKASRALESSDWRRYETYLASRPDQAELDAIELLLALCSEYRFKLHIVHLATAKGLELLRMAKAEGLPVTVETCPHYLHFAAEEIRDGATLCKCAPPIRSASNRELLWQGVRDGIIDLVATDHSPCPPEMKRLEEGSFRTAWGGISSLSVALPVMWSSAYRREFMLQDLARWMAEKPAELAGCSARKGKIAEGYDADFVIFDAESEFTLTEDRLHYRHRVSPYLGQRLRGVVKRTYLRGRCIFQDGEFPGEPGGRECRRNAAMSSHR